MKKYTVWVGGVPVGEGVDYAKAMRIWDHFDLEGYEDVIVEQDK